MVLLRRPAPAHPRFPSGTTAQLHTCVFASPSTETAEHLSRRHHVGSALLYLPTRQANSAGVVFLLLEAAGNAPVRPNLLLSAGRSDFCSFKRPEICPQVRPGLLFSFPGRTLAASKGLKRGKCSDLTSFFSPEVGLHPSERPQMRRFAPTQLAFLNPWVGVPPKEASKTRSRRAAPQKHWKISSPEFEF